MTAPFTPAPVVTLSGATLAGGGSGAQVVLAGVQVSWGSDALFGQPDLPTATARVFDRSRTWAVTNDLLGERVTVGYRHSDTTRGTVSGLSFDGRVSEVAVTPARLGGVDGSMVTLTCASILADLGNTTPTVAWPQESLAARRSRLATAIGYPLTTEATVWDTSLFAAVTAGSQSTLLEHLASFYASMATRYTFDPTAATIRYAAPTPRPSGAGVASLVTDTTTNSVGTGAVGWARRNAGVYVRALPQWQGEPAGMVGLYLDASTTRPAAPGGPIATRSQAQRITHVTVSYENGETTVAVPNVDASVKGRRLATVQTQHAATSPLNVYAGTVMADRISKEGQRWQPPPVLWRQVDHGGFESTDLMHTLLGGYERPAAFFLQGSQYTTDYGFLPVVMLLGATITHTGQGWEVALSLAAVATESKIHSLTWEEMTGVTWSDTPTATGMHSSLTYEDLRYVSAPLGSNTPGATTTWDEVFTR